MSTKGGQGFTFSFPGGDSPPFPPVSYATASDALLANLRHASTNWWKVNKNFIQFSWDLFLLFYCNAYYSCESTKTQSN